MAARKEKSAPAFSHLNNVASAQNGAKILFATDDFFALAENLIEDAEPVWKENEYTEFGKWMDGWETRRKRIPGHDFCIIKLAYRAVITGVEVNTAYFTGNHAPKISIQASGADYFNIRRNAVLGSSADENSVNLLRCTESWEEILPVSALQPGYADSCRMYFHVQGDKTWRFLRFNMYPDGGVARLRVYGHVKNLTDSTGNDLDLISFENGGEVVAFSDAHFGHPRNLLKTGRGRSMADGWETARRLDRPPILKALSNGAIQYNGSEWCIIKMGQSGIMQKVEIDTNHFKGNYPDTVKIEGGVLTDVFKWTLILENRKLKANERHFFGVNCAAVFTHIRITVTPDGGISRLRVIGIKQ